MTAVLISIKPKWCELIASGIKTVEVRKSKPKRETPFKVYIYCTSVKNIPLSEYVKIHKRTSGKIDDWHGKVIGEFICDKIYQYSTVNVEGIDISDEDMIRFSCLSKEELCDYEMSAEPKENCVYRVGLYGWHISDLVIYDKPIELSEFFVKGDCNGDCKMCKYFEAGNGYDVEDDCLLPYQIGYGNGLKPLFRPPQSWCYVEEVQE